MKVVLSSGPAVEPIMRKRRNIVNSQAFDLTGKKFGRWTVISRAENTPTGSAKWLCKCSCGSEKIVRSEPLRLGKTTSCGCYRTECLHKRSGDRHPSFKTGRHRNTQGYVVVLDRKHHRSRNGYVFEHIKVMEKFLGRPLLLTETVHHKNGIKDDNRIENLELWTRNHATGVRAVDMIEFCTDYLRKYAPHVLTKETPCGLC